MPTPLFYSEEERLEEGGVMAVLRLVIKDGGSCPPPRLDYRPRGVMERGRQSGGR